MRLTWLLKVTVSIGIVFCWYSQAFSDSFAPKVWSVENPNGEIVINVSQIPQKLLSMKGMKTYPARHRQENPNTNYTINAEPPSIPEVVIPTDDGWVIGWSHRIANGS